MPLSSFPRRRESSDFRDFWTPAFAGVTVFGTFYECINIQCSKRLSAGGGLNFGHWDLFGIWVLWFGIYTISLGFMMCTEMSMSGARIGLIERIIPKALQSLPKALCQGWRRRYGAVTGEAQTGIAGAHHAVSVHRNAAATAWVFVWSRWSKVCSGSIFTAKTQRAQRKK